MKTLKDTVEGMLSKDWKTRLVAEIEQCDLRLMGIHKRMLAIGTDDPEYPVLNSQSIHMIDYLNDLLARAACYGIEFSLPSGEASHELGKSKMCESCSDSDDEMIDPRCKSPLSDEWARLFLLLYLFGGNE